MRRNKPLTCTFVQVLDKVSMLRRLARLRGSARRRPALGRAIVVLALATTLSFAAGEKIENAEADYKKPFNVMDLKLYLHNEIQDWAQFECANWLGIKESNWRPKAVNPDSGAYGIFQSMSDYAKTWNAYEQIDKAVEYIDHRYQGDWCKALDHLETYGWH